MVTIYLWFLHWWRKIQQIGLACSYNDKNSDIAKWLLKFFGLSLLPANEIEDAFVEDIMDDAPSDAKCVEFADYVYKQLHFKWLSIPSKRMGLFPWRFSSNNKWCRIISFSSKRTVHFSSSKHICVCWDIVACSNWNICHHKQYLQNTFGTKINWESRDVTRPQPHEAEAEAEATTHEAEAEAEATTHEAEAEAEATTHEAEAEAEAKTHL